MGTEGKKKDFVEQQTLNLEEEKESRILIQEEKSI